MMRTIFHAAAAAVFGAVLTAALSASAQAAPTANSRGIAVTAEKMSLSDGLVLKAVTRAGVHHRSARRTARRVNRRHTY